MKHIVFIITLLAFGLASCNDWLDVRPETEQKDYDQFSSENGFFDALVGAYMTMANANAYGERLTISNVESLACLWYMNKESQGYSGSRLADWQLTQHDYLADEARAAIQNMYAGLFATVAQANMILKYADEQGGVFTDKKLLDLVKGEAYAIRAYCQFDLLRLFGQMPKNVVKQVQLPYSLVTGIVEMPAYYDFAAYVGLLKEDLKQAETLLKDSDPIFEHTFNELNGKRSDVKVKTQHLYYRQTRLNYWAVKALQARMCLYLGETAEANRLANELMTAKGADGKPVREMSGLTDLNKEKYMLCPNECLFALSKYDIMKNTEGFLIGKNESAQFNNSRLLISKEMQKDLYVGENTASHNRYNSWWTEVKTNQGRADYRAINKYWWEEKAENQMLFYQLVPMLRMSEICLIAMETSTDLVKANALYKQYMAAHNVGNAKDFATLDDMRAWVLDEYRREFYAEGQMFYAYKRTGATQMKWQEKAVDETAYILPLPETEFNPNNLK